MLGFRYKKSVAFFLLLALAAMGVGFYNQPSHFIQENYHVSAQAARALAFSLIVPYVAELYFVMLAYLSVRRYSDTIGESPERRAFQAYQRGLYCVALYVSCAPLLAGLIVYVQKAHPAVTDDAVQAANYIFVTVGLISGAYFYMASERFLALVKRTGRTSRLATNIGALVVSILYVVLVYHSSARFPAPSPSLFSFMFPSAFYEPDWLSSITIIIPRIVAWYLTVLAVENFYVFRARVSGKIYRAAFRYVPIAIASVLLSIMLLRFTQLLPFDAWDVDPWLIQIIAYIIAGIGVTGFVLLARSTGKLYKIEKV